MNPLLARIIPFTMCMCFTIALHAQKAQVIEFCVENEAVRHFLATSNATFCEIPSNLPQSFYDAKRDYRPDQPAQLVITFTSPDATQAKVYLSTDKRFKNSEFIANVDVKDGKGYFILRNLIPGTIYYFRAIGNGKKVIASGKIKTTGQVRMISIDGGFNIRDLGGWRGLGGKTLKYGMLYRGGSLGGTDKDGNTSTIAKADMKELSRLGIGAQLDLRAKTNAGKYAGEGSLHSYSAGFTNIPLADFNNTMTDYGAYNEDASIISNIAWIISELKKNRPVYFNCRQGADRTGTIAFLIEGLLGCYEYATPRGANQMALDYELTGFSQANLIDNWKVVSSCRPAAEAYNNRHKLFRQLLDLEASEPEIRLQNLQQRCYYYLNRYKGHKDAPRIDQNDLDWFITSMLGMTSKEYAVYKPSWATTGNNLQETGEACANVASYADVQP